MTTTKAKLEFVHAMARHTRATVRQCEALMRYAATLQRLAEDDCNIATDDVGLARREAKRRLIQSRIWNVLDEIGGEANQLPETAIHALFQNDPRGAVVRIRVPDGWSDDFGGEGICVPS